MLPVNCGSHSDYQNFVVKNLRKYYPNPDSIARSTCDIIDRFWNLDLSFTNKFIRDKYAVFGPKPRTPSCMQRSFLLSIDFKVTSLTDWAAQLKINPLYAILSVFSLGIPWASVLFMTSLTAYGTLIPTISPHINPTKDKAKKPKIKGSKAAPVEKVSVEQLLPKLENTAFRIEEQPYGSLFQLYKSEFLYQSVSKGLITPENLALAGDGTPVITSHRERKHRICDCATKGITDCTCNRYFSQPDCDIGWASSRDCWYHGYALYMLVASDSESDLPAMTQCPIMNTAGVRISLLLLT